MSTPEPSPRALVDALIDALDPRLQPKLRSELQLALARRTEGVRQRKKQELPVVLVGHRAAGKTRALPLMAQLLGRPGLDLDDEVARAHGRPIAAWVREDVASFRRAEREVFQKLPPRVVVAVGGGFLSLHSDLLKACLPVLIPVSFETYRERLLQDATRPRLLPHLLLEEEISQVFQQREALHLATRTAALSEFLAELLGERQP